jgi:GTP-binding protein HflX
MNELYDNSPQVERALLVGLESDRIEAREAASLLRELSGLASSLGVEPVTTMMVKLREKTANLLLGSGKADEIAAAAKAEGVDSIIFDHPLSPIQQRNWEKLTGLKVYDRAELIIKIFSARALTREAGLQVELARLEYALPRLAHSYEELSRQRGGRYGTKGSGEQKIELDRRSIERRIHELKEELKVVRKSRDVQRKRRQRLPLPRAAIVGYTNAGKSSLLNAMTKAEVLAEDKLFAPLDPTTRRLCLGSGASLLLTEFAPGSGRSLQSHPGGGVQRRPADSCGGWSRPGEGTANGYDAPGFIRNRRRFSSPHTRAQQNRPRGFRNPHGLAKNPSRSSFRIG